LTADLRRCPADLRRCPVNRCLFYRPDVSLIVVYFIALMSCGSRQLVGGAWFFYSWLAGFKTWAFVWCILLFSLQLPQLVPLPR